MSIDPNREMPLTHGIVQHYSPMTKYAVYLIKGGLSDQLVHDSIELAINSEETFAAFMTWTGDQPQAIWNSQVLAVHGTLLDGLQAHARTVDTASPDLTRVFPAPAKSTHFISAKTRVLAVTRDYPETELFEQNALATFARNLIRAGWGTARVAQEIAGHTGSSVAVTDLTVWVNDRPFGHTAAAAKPQSWHTPGQPDQSAYGLHLEVADYPNTRPHWSALWTSDPYPANEVPLTIRIVKPHEGAIGHYAMYLLGHGLADAAVHAAILGIISSTEAWAGFETWVVNKPHHEWNDVWLAIPDGDLAAGLTLAASWPDTATPDPSVVCPYPTPTPTHGNTLDLAIGFEGAIPDADTNAIVAYARYLIVKNFSDSAVAAELALYTGTPALRAALTTWVQSRSFYADHARSGPLPWVGVPDGTSSAYSLALATARYPSEPHDPTIKRSHIESLGQPGEATTTVNTYPQSIRKINKATLPAADELACVAYARMLIKEGYSDAGVGHALAAVLLTDMTLMHFGEWADTTGLVAAHSQDSHGETTTASLNITGAAYPLIASHGIGALWPDAPTHPVAIKFLATQISNSLGTDHAWSESTQQHLVAYSRLMIRAGFLDYQLLSELGWLLRHGAALDRFTDWATTTDLLDDHLVGEDFGTSAWSLMSSAAGADVTGIDADGVDLLSERYAHGAPVLRTTGWLTAYGVRTPGYDQLLSYSRYLIRAGFNDCEVFAQLGPIIDSPVSLSDFINWVATGDIATTDNMGDYLGSSTPQSLSNTAAFVGPGVGLDSLLWRPGPECLPVPVCEFCGHCHHDGCPEQDHSTYNIPSGPTRNLRLFTAVTAVNGHYNEIQYRSTVLARMISALQAL